MRPGFLRGFWKLSWVETKIFVREPMGFVGALVVPVVIFVVLGRVFGAARPRATPHLDIPFNPAILAAVLIAIGGVQSLVAIMAKVAKPKKTTDAGTYDVVFRGSRFTEIEMRLQRIERRLKIKGRTIVRAKDGSYIMK